MMYERYTKLIAKEVARTLTLDDILLMLYIVDAFIDIQEETKRVTERWQRLTATRPMFRSVQEQLMYEMLKGETAKPEREEEEEEEEEPNRKTLENMRAKFEELISKIKARSTEREIRRAKRTINEAKRLGLIEEEEAEEIEQLVKKREQELKTTEEQKKETEKTDLE